MRAPVADDPAAQKGGRRISFTLRPAHLPSRNGAMTPFLMNAGAAAHPKSMRRPPFPAPPTPRTTTSGAPQRGSSPRGSDGVVLLEPGDGARDHPAQTRWRARAATAGAVDRASRGNRHHAKGFTRGASCRGGTSAQIAGWPASTSLNPRERLLWPTLNKIAFESCVRWKLRGAWYRMRACLLM